MIGKWILGVAIASLVVQLMILAILAFWSVELLQTANALSHWTTPNPAPTSPWGGF